MDWNWIQIIGAGILGGIMTGVPILIKAYLDINKANTDSGILVQREIHESANEDRLNLIREHENSRLGLLREYTQLKDELKADVISLKEQISKLQEAHLQCALENVRLQGQIRELKFAVLSFKRCKQCQSISEKPEQDD